MASDKMLLQFSLFRTHLFFKFAQLLLLKHFEPPHAHFTTRCTR